MTDDCPGCGQPAPTPPCTNPLCTLSDRHRHNLCPVCGSPPALFDAEHSDLHIAAYMCEHGHKYAVPR